MPTRYTSKLYDGEQGFSDFVMGCARGMGALITMREDSSDAEIPEEFTPDPFYQTHLEEALAEAQEIENWTHEEAELAAETGHQRDLSRWQEETSKQVVLKGRYEAMMDRVRLWAPPTPEHERLKDFMIEQLTISMEGDCSGRSEPQKMTPAEFKADKLRTARCTAQFAQEQVEKEEKRVKERTEWVRVLRESIKGYPDDRS